MKNLDKVNRQIINKLQENSSITNAELAEQLKLPTTTVFDRIKKLLRSVYTNDYEKKE